MNLDMTVLLSFVQTETEETALTRRTLAGSVVCEVGLSTCGPIGLLKRRPSSPELSLTRRLTFVSEYRGILDSLGAN